MIDQAATAYSEETSHTKNLEEATLEELEDLEDLEDDRVLDFYRKKRMAEMNEVAKKMKFGFVAHISKPDYTAQVTDASKECPVVVLLYRDSLPLSRLVTQFCETLALKYRATKFVRIISDQCIPNYPDFNVPTLLIYVKGEMRAQLVAGTFEKLGGMDMSITKFENELEKYGAVEDLFAMAGLTSSSSNIRGSNNAAKNADDYDSDDDEKTDGVKKFTIRTATKKIMNDDDDDWN